MTPGAGETHPTADSILQQLQAAAEGNKQRMGTLHRLVQACRALAAKGSDFSLRDIEAYCKTTFSKGPNAQTISNDKALRAYVDALRNEANLQRRGRAKSSLDQDVEAITNPDLRSRMRVMVEDCRLVQKRFRILTEALSKLNPPLDVGFLLSGKRALGAQPLFANNTSVSSDQVEALTRLTRLLRDEQRIRRAGLNLDEGDIVGKGFRETLISRTDIAYLESLATALTGPGKDVGNEE